MTQVEAVLVEQQDRREHPVGVLLDELRQRIEHGRQRSAGRDELEQLGLPGRERVGPPALADVPQIATQVAGLPVLIADETALVTHPDLAPVTADQPVLERVGLTRLERRGMRDEHAIAVVRMQDRLKEAGVRGPILGRVAKHRRRLVAREDVRRERIRRVEVDDHRKLVDELAIQRSVRGRCRLALRIEGNAEVGVTHSNSCIGCTPGDSTPPSEGGPRSRILHGTVRTEVEPLYAAAR